MADDAARALETVRAATPLVQCLTNVVTVNFVANALLALGASPAMVDTPGEAAVMAEAASAVLVNLGTPTAEHTAGMLEAAQRCAETGTPWVLDPVAVGALPTRTALARELLELRPTIIRGNASEIRALSGSHAGGRGVDAQDAVEDALASALDLANRTGGVVAVSGPVDLVTNGDAVVRIRNGHPWLTRITGGGCALGGVVAAFAGAVADPLLAAVASSAAYGLAAERAAARSAGPGSFAAALLDELDALTPERLQEGALLA